MLIQTQFPWSVLAGCAQVINFYTGAPSDQSCAPGLQAVGPKPNKTIACANVWGDNYVHVARTPSKFSNMLQEWRTCSNLRKQVGSAAQHKHYTPNEGRQIKLLKAFLLQLYTLGPIYTLSQKRKRHYFAHYQLSFLYLQTLNYFLQFSSGNWAI